MPPDALTVALPLLLLWHNAFVCAMIVASRTEAGSVMVAVAVVVHECASVTVTV